VIFRNFRDGRERWGPWRGRKLGRGRRGRAYCPAHGRSGFRNILTCLKIAAKGRRRPLSRRGLCVAFTPTLRTVLVWCTYICLHVRPTSNWPILATTSFFRFDGPQNNPPRAPSFLSPHLLDRLASQSTALSRLMRFRARPKPTLFTPRTQPTGKAQHT
jgi:hypothetical protein